MRNPHNLISTERIMEKVWGYDSDAEINVVWVYISYLRKKLMNLGRSRRYLSLLHQQGRPRPRLVQLPVRG